MGFKDELKVFQQEVLSLQCLNENEAISEEDVVSALVTLNFIRYGKVPDAFLGCSAINLLNTYVKQKGAKLSYQFRRHMENIIKGIADINQKKTIKVFYDDSQQGGILMISFWDFQFSFHFEKLTNQIRQIHCEKSMEWDGIKKQICAKSIYDFAVNSIWLSNQTLDNCDLKELIEKEKECYRNGGYKFVNGCLIKTQGVQFGKPQDDKYSKNYIREKLSTCQGRPVILSGKFKKVWDKHITFTTIRPYIQGCNTLTICNHINLYRPDVEKVFDISQLEKDRNYYIIGYCKPYPKSERMGVKLAIGFDFIPIIRSGKTIPKSVFSVCNRFSIEEFLHTKQTHLKL